MKRPFGVTIIAALVLLSALFDLATGIWMMLAPLGANPTLTDLAGNSQEVPGFFLFINGLLSFILGLMYLWLMKMTLIGSGTAYVLVNFLSILNIFFGLFRLPFGWAIIVLSAVVLLLANTKAAKAWFTQAT